MRVIAIKPGFYKGSLIRAGNTFDVADGVTASWFTPVEKASKQEAKVETSEPQTLSELAKQDGEGLLPVIDEPEATAKSKGKGKGKTDLAKQDTDDLV